MDYAIITENDESKWEDQTGILYHFPAKYKNILTQGTKVIYYKGAIKNGKYIPKRLSKKPHYFGIAIIGEVYPDVNNKNQYFAELDDYIPFSEPIIFKEKDEYLEYVSKSNYWRDGVRNVTEEVYTKILSRTNLDIKSTHSGEIEVEIKEETLPSLTVVSPKLANNLLSQKTTMGIGRSSKKSNRGNTFSKNAKKIGDRAEEIVFEYLKKCKMTNIRWLAKEGEKPGYDISCFTPSGEKIYIEVKGTTTNKFDGFILTSNELEASKDLGGKFFIYFVTECLSTNPKIQPVQNPYEKLKFNEWLKTPISYKVSFS
ncbi:DUF3883 domain-containing protein [Cytobacillus oceanisediminis]|uniref:DUF3883 domain-containing protein n=1 Tax=Cytobacillus oceanisediminis TaxID=665099 RepID=UPI001C23EEAA|nr:DUF3883 domain-containing protein [Cytobacillus oceanisediminis]MBU8768770.1 DUF3883 domain-containing protein [Cytobacillus oceanisediminis]